MVGGIIIVAAAIFLIIIFQFLEPRNGDYLYWGLGIILILLTIALGINAIVHDFARKEIGNYIQHPEEYQVDTIQVNGIIDHYEVMKK